MNPSWRTNYIRYKSYFFNVVGKYRDRADVRAYLEVLLSLATVSMFSVFALRPTLLTIGQLIREIDSKRQLLAKIEEKIQNLSSAQTLFDRERAKIFLLNSAVSDKPNPLVFARQMEGLSAKNQVVIARISTGEAVVLGQQSVQEATAEGIAPLPESAASLEFSFEATSSLDQYQLLQNFVSDIEKLRIPLKLDLVTISTKEDKEQKGLLLSIDGRIPILGKGEINK